MLRHFYLTLASISRSRRWGDKAFEFFDDPISTQLFWWRWRLDRLLRLPGSYSIASTQRKSAQRHPRRHRQRQGHFAVVHKRVPPSWDLNRNLDRYDRVVSRPFWTSQLHAMLKSCPPSLVHRVLRGIHTGNLVSICCGCFLTPGRVFYPLTVAVAVIFVTTNVVHHRTPTDRTNVSISQTACYTTAHWTTGIHFMTVLLAHSHSCPQRPGRTYPCPSFLATSRDLVPFGSLILTFTVPLVPLVRNDN